jgi:hypothetical protein
MNFITTTHWPKIALVTPCFRHAHFLEATIDSVLSQGYPNLEYVIVDGGSDDGTVEVIRKYERHLHWWCSEPDDGHYDAVNKGFRHTTGDIMAWINSDDIHLPWTLRTVGSIFSALNEVSWISSLEQTRIDYHGFCLGSERIAGFSREAFARGCYVANPGHRAGFLGWIQQESTFWRRCLWDAVGGSIRTRFSLAGDFDLWARFYRHADLFGATSPLAGFRLSEQQRSSQADAYRAQAIASLKDTSAPEAGVPPGRPRRARSFFSRFRLPTTGRFSGRRIVRTQRDRPDGSWKIEEHRFRCPLKHLT